MSFANFNATSFLQDHPTPEQYYATHDWSSLSYFEKQWAMWYIWIGNPTLATGLMSFIMHEVVYFGRCIPWIIVDAIPYFRKWKIQPNKVPSKKEQWECTKLVLLTHFTVELPQIWLFHPIAEYFGMSTYQVPFPPLQTMIFQITLFFIFEDLWHYLTHQMLHYGPLYRRIHKLHHRYSAPFGLAAEYAHPLEILILGGGTISGPILYSWGAQRWWKGHWAGEFHILSMYVWIVLRLFQAVDAHSGYDFPWSLRHFIPFWSGADHHDFHHMAFTNNFATSFRYLDRIFGTDTKFRAYKKRMAEAKKARQAELAKAGITTGVSREDEKRIEDKLNEETEREGLRAEREAERGNVWGVTRSKVQ